MPIKKMTDSRKTENWSINSDARMHQNWIQGADLRTTVTIDDELFQRALEVADPGTEKGDLFREAVKVFVRVQAGKRLAALGGKARNMKEIPRRRPKKMSSR